MRKHTENKNSSFGRSIKTALLNLWRNKFLSIATIAVMALILFIFNIILTLNLLSQGVINELYKEVDMVVYLRDDADLFTVNTVVEELQSMDEVIEASYTSKDEALKNYLEIYEEDPFSTYGIENPLPANIKITTASPEYHETIKEFLNLEKYDNLFLTIESKSENENIAEQILSIGNYTKNLVMAVLLTFIAASFLVILNAIYLTVFSRKREIEIMNLVGAEPSFIRRPFLLEGISMSTAAVILSIIMIYGFISSIGLDATLAQIVNPRILAITILLQITVSVGVGALSSYIAIQNHLSVRR